MATGEAKMGLVMVLLAALFGATAMAQSSCQNVLITMAPCLNYVTGSSPTPSSSCCSQLASVVKAQPQCLCYALNGGGAALGISINQTLALALPAACKVQTPPVSLCNNDGGSPAGSPEGLPGDSSNSPTSSPSTGGSKTVPSTSNSFSMGMNMSKPLQLLLFVVFMASCASSIHF